MKKSGQWLGVAFGAAFSITILAVAALVPQISPTGMFVSQILLGLAVAGLSTVMLQTLHVSKPRYRGVIALALFCIVVLANPFKAVRESDLVRSNRALEDGRLLIDRGDVDYGISLIELAQQLKAEDIADLPYYIALSEITTSNYLSANKHLDQALKLLKRGKAFTVAEGDIISRIGEVEESRGNIERALEVKESAISADFSRPEDRKTLDFDIGRLSLQLWLMEPIQENRKRLEDAYRIFQRLDGKWADLDSKIWGTYFLGCAAKEMSTQTDLPDNERRRLFGTSIRLGNDFRDIVSSLRGYLKYKTKVLISVMLYEKSTRASGFPFACDFPSDISSLRATYAAE